MFRITRSIKSRFIGGESGAALVIVALSMTFIFGLAALAIDMGSARAATRQAQAGVDGGSLAAAQDLPLLGGPAYAATNAVKAEAARNLAAEYAATSMFQGTVPPVVPGALSGNTRTYTVDDVTLTITSPYTAAGSSVPNYSLIYVKACRPTGTFFASAIGATVKNVCREGVARRRNSAGGLGIGMLALDSTSCKSMTFGGSSQTNLIPTGAVVANSTCANNALSDEGTSWTLDTDFIGVVGGADIACPDCTGTPPTVPMEGVDPIADPLASLIEPTAPLVSGSCIETAKNSGVQVCTPGRYISGLSLGSNDTYILRPGLYYVEGGFSSGAGSSAICINSPVTVPSSGGLCDGVTFFIKSGAVNLNGNGTVSLPPPSAGTCTAYDTCGYIGVTIFQSRTNTTELSINGTADFSIGTVYAPAANLKLNGNAGSDEIGITGMVVGKSIEVSGTFDLNIDVDPPASYEPPEDDYGLEK